MQTNDGGYIISGQTNSFGSGSGDVYLIKTDASGFVLWTKTFGGTSLDLGNSVRQTADRGYIIGGYTQSFGAGVFDFYLIKTDSTGTAQWSKTYGGTGSDFGYSVRQTADRGYIIAGSTTSFGATNGDIYIVKTDSLGNSGCNELVPATVISTGGLLTSGVTQTYSGGLTATPFTLSGTGSGSNSTTLCLTVGMEQQVNPENSISIFPNPFKYATTINAENNLENATLTLFNSIGQQVKEIKNISGQLVTFSRENLASGLYFIRIIEDNRIIATDKLIISE